MRLHLPLCGRSPVSMSLPALKNGVSFCPALRASSEGWRMQLALSLWKGQGDCGLEPLKQDCQAVSPGFRTRNAMFLFGEGSVGRTPGPAPMVFRRRNLLGFPTFLWSLWAPVWLTITYPSAEQQPGGGPAWFLRLPGSIQLAFPWARA